MMPLSAHDKSININQLKTSLEEIQRKHDVPAFAVVLVDPDKIIFSQVKGMADRDRAIEATFDTIFRIGSITKMFTALAVLMLQEDGLVNINAPITSIDRQIPVSNPWRKTYPITVAQLLEHTAGLTEMSKEEFDFNTPLTLEEALSWKATERITKWPPGHHYSYTNVGAGLIQHIIEKLSNKSYAQYLSDRIFSPLGMTSANVLIEKNSSALAVGYNTDAHTPIPYWHMLYPAFGAINVRPVEMTRFIQMLLNNGVNNGQRLLTKAAINRMETPGTSLSARAGLKFSYGLGNYTRLNNEQLFHGHGGDADGYLSRLAYNRSSNMGYFLVINSFQHHAIDEMELALESLITLYEQTETITPPGTDKKEVKSLEGDYRPHTSPFPASLDEKVLKIMLLNDGKLLVKYDKMEQTLIQSSKWLFRESGQNVASSAFVRDQLGDIYFQHQWGNFRKIE